MENSYLEHLDSMLASALLDAIKADKEDVDKVVKNLSQLIKFSNNNPKLDGKVRISIQWVLENVLLPEKPQKEFESHLESLGGSIRTEPLDEIETASTEVSVGQEVPKFQICLAQDILSDTRSKGWNRVYGSELDKFLDQISPIDGKYFVSGSSTLVDWANLPFYQNVAIIRVHEPMWINSRMVIYYLTYKGNLFRLNGTSPPIHEVNAKSPIQLTEDNALDYLKFFCFFVRGEKGPFYVVENTKDPLFPKDIDETTLLLIEESAHPLKIKEIDSNGNFLCDALVFYSNALFEASFSIQRTGMVEMLNDEPIAGDLLCKIDAPIS